MQFHELRHTFPTLARKSGALDMHELIGAMVHTNYAITHRVYAINLVLHDRRDGAVDEGVSEVEAASFLAAVMRAAAG
jgi:hypothetical protein